MQDAGSSKLFPDDTPVEVRYPVTAQQGEGDRAAWPWLSGLIVQQCGPDEWQARVEARQVATLEDGSPAPDGTPDDDLYFPLCFRDSSEIRALS